MRQRLIKKLDYKERHWLYKAVFRMILADKTVAKEEVDELLDTLRRIAGRDIKDFTEITHSHEFMEPLQRLKGIPFDHAFIIVAEIIRAASIDCHIALEEEELLREILSLLDFNEGALTKVLDWAKKLARINSEEFSLKEELAGTYGVN